MVTARAHEEVQGIQLSMLGSSVKGCSSQLTRRGETVSLLTLSVCTPTPPTGRAPHLSVLVAYMGRIPPHSPCHSAPGSRNSPSVGRRSSSTPVLQCLLAAGHMKREPSGWRHISMGTPGSFDFPSHDSSLPEITRSELFPAFKVPKMLSTPFQLL